MVSQNFDISEEINYLLQWVSTLQRNYHIKFNYRLDNLLHILYVYKNDFESNKSYPSSTHNLQALKTRTNCFSLTTSSLTNL